MASREETVSGRGGGDLLPMPVAADAGKLVYVDSTGAAFAFAAGITTDGDNITFRKEVAHTISVAQSTTASTAGAAFTFTGASGSVASGATAGAAGGAATFQAGVGGAAAAGAGAAGAGGVMTVRGGAGGAGSATGVAGAGQTLLLRGGAAGANGGAGGANGGSCSIQGGSPSGAGTAGTIVIGTSAAASITFGNATDNTTYSFAGSGSFTITPPTINFFMNTASPTISQQTQTTAGQPGQTLAITAQSCTDAAAVAATLAGKLSLSAGSATAGNGSGGHVLVKGGAKNGTGLNGNISLHADAANYQAMERGVFVGDCTTAPTGNPANGGFLYSNAGALTWRGSGGTTTVMAAA